MRRGDELGYFAYGGSTIVAVFPRDFITFDEDLLRYSAPSAGNADQRRPIETLMKVGYSLGRWNGS